MKLHSFPHIWMRVRNPMLQRVSIPRLGRKLADIMYEGQGTLDHRARIWVYWSSLHGAVSVRSPGIFTSLHQITVSSQVQQGMSAG